MPTVVAGILVLAVGGISGVAYNFYKSTVTREDFSGLVCALCLKDTLKGDSICTRYGCHVSVGFNVGDQSYEAVLASQVPLKEKNAKGGSVDGRTAAKAPLKIEVPNGPPVNLVNPIYGNVTPTFLPFVVVDMKDKSKSMSVPPSNWRKLFEDLKTQPSNPVSMDLKNR